MLNFNFKNYKKFTILIVISLLLALGDYFKLLNSVKGFFEEKVVIPFKKRNFNPKPENNCFSYQAEILSLKTQIASLKEENSSARKLLGAPLPSDWKFLPVKVIDQNDDEIIIDGGKNLGIKENMVAIFEGVFVGRVKRVSQNISKILVVTSFDSREVVKIINKETLSLSGKGLLVGRGREKIEIKEILAEEGVEEGDLLVVTVEGFDLPIGRIKKVNYQKGEVFKTALGIWEINPRYLQTIFLFFGKI